MNKSQDNIYYNTVIQNTYSDRDLLVKFSETRSYSIIDKPNDYYLTIARLHLPIDRIPIFKFKDNYYSITLITYIGGVEIQRQQKFIEYVPFTTLTDDRKNIYTYSHMVYMINNTFTELFNLLAIKPAGAISPPRMEFYDQSSPLVIRVNLTGYSYGDPARIDIYFNTNLFSLFENFPYIFNGYSPTNPEDNYKLFNIADTIVQEYPTYYLWWQYESLFITTYSLPVSSENQAFNSRYNNTLETTNSILTDFVPIQFGTSETKTPITYIPQPQYRLIDLFSDTPLRTFDFQIFFRGKDGSIIPARLHPGATCSIKFLFIKKDIANKY